HKVPGRGLRARHLQRPRLRLLVQRIPGHNLPLVEHQAHHGLALRVYAHVGLEAEGVDDRQEAADGVQGRAGERAVGQDVAPAAREDGVDGRDRVGGAGHGDGVEGFHQARGGGEERRVDGSARRGDDLAAAPRDGVCGERDVRQLELGVADRFLAQRPLARAPTEALAHRVPH
ncbi:MAG: hypothetical protein LQ340_003954, partial [Diploschistes diacapsis]